MATQQLQLVCDSSTLANFKQWAQAVSSWFSTCGWTKAADTGQVNWSTISAVPGSGAFIYEIWQPGDALTAFYVKIEYGNLSGTNCPSLRLSIGTGTNGSGTLTGYFTPATNINQNSFTAPSTTTQYECNFCGTSSKIAVMLWRNGSNSCQQCFAIQRSLNSSGLETSGYVTFWTCGNGNRGVQQTVVFAVGVAPPLCGGASGTVAGVTNVSQTAFVRGVIAISHGTEFNGSIPIDLCSPLVGYWDNECTVLGTSDYSLLAEGITFQVTLYGVTKTYMPAGIGPFGLFPFGNGGQNILCMEYD